MKINYQKKLDEIIENEENHGKKLLIHSCCGPCSSYVLEYLSRYFRIIVFYYNPNIYPAKEIDLRIHEQREVISHIQGKYPVELKIGEYCPEKYYRGIAGHEKEKEGSIRCYKCYQLRMEEAAKMAKEWNCDYYTTTLSISPHKRADWINEIGKEFEKIYGVKHLPSDFKKKGGYQRSVELSKKWQIYRQDYCGCVFSKKEKEEREKEKEEIR
ncbi:MAG: epoxyqueuosine reductase QueH [Tissierellia bacterium]|nr:epoxyqueuosine reductase QueH [Tissierellia bacterium]